METKKCSKCGEVKGVEEFGKRKDSLDGLRNECKSCLRAHNLQYRKNLRQEISSRGKQYYRENTEDIKFKTKNHYKANKEYCKQYAKIYRKENTKQISIDRIQHYQENKKQILERCDQYRVKNKEKINQKNLIRRKEDIQFKLSSTIRTRILRAIKEQYSKKAYKSMELLGCSIAFARQHIEDQFTIGMTWDNHSLYGWHIDHIKPCASFDLTDPEQQKQCFNYTNLQPLWAEDNLSKGAKYIE